ncbi:hypothetical protein PUNSTDRAFT_108165 [Punctularia strigosozonata HHB-11173 SS5]|uniref:Oxidoreductase AflY n=1 Tax=Punctularia strigosozonata (strain HHB-11173) TaxID=741275 RepID=R7S537_PUNST|nr:uncharacterized protein PUNSTDRAFT_108165 [Punctularia strigosozonata HHB-11173 SS5]EIN04426.1 hypothetical protein PUNSTDRAFT_108165 [Punctularia strigosozonata HHB-11173 SS5]
MSLDELFPSVLPPPTSHLSPGRWPGIDQSSTTYLANTLKDNHEKWHIFFNDRGFHNHTAHRLLALWTLGGNGELIEAAYEQDKKSQRDAFKSPSEITTDNFTEHLGDERYYNAYVNFFVDAIKKNGAKETLETYIFSHKFNFGGKTAESHPHLLNRFIGGLLHPLIHTGYGIEFGIPGILVEGLAQTCVHAATSPTLMVESLFDQGPPKSASAFARVTSLLPSLSISSTTSQLPVPTSASKTHALTILARVLKDPLFSPRRPRDLAESAADVLNDEDRVSKILAYTDEWLGGAEGHIEEKLEEIAWTNVLIYGVGGFTKGKDFNADFFLMHLVTSSLFIPSLVLALKPASQLALLHAYFATVLTEYVGRGRPALGLESFYHNTSTDILPPEQKEPITAQTFGARGVKTVPNPWLPLIQSVLGHPDDHVPKIQRALAHYATLYSHRYPGYFSKALEDADEKLPGLELLDSTLFVRVAGLTMDRVGWVREGQPEGGWDMAGFFDVV